MCMESRGERLESKSQLLCLSMRSALGESEAM